MHQPYSPRRTPNIIVQKGELFYWAEDEAPLKKTLAHYGFKQVDSASIYDIAAELSEKEKLSISQDEILKYLAMFFCEL